MSKHAHVIDPDWSTMPIAWAPEADPTMPGRLHAACMDRCEECLTDLAHEGAASAETTAVVMAMVNAIALEMKEQGQDIRARVSSNKTMREVDDRLATVAMQRGQSSNAYDVVAIMRDLNADERFDVVEPCVQVLGVYTWAMTGDEPG